MEVDDVTTPTCSEFAARIETEVKVHDESRADSGALQRSESGGSADDLDSDEQDLDDLLASLPCNGPLARSGSGGS